MIEADPDRKLEGVRFVGPCTVSQVHDNDTAKLTKATTRGAVSQTWNIRKLRPV